MERSKDFCHAKSEVIVTTLNANATRIIEKYRELNGEAVSWWFGAGGMTETTLLWS